MAPSRRVRRRRRQYIVGLVTAVVAIVAVLQLTGGGTPARHPTSHPTTTTTGRTSAGAERLSANWRGDGRPVTLAFGGDVHFEAMLADRLTIDPTTALGTGTPALLAGANLSMADLDSAVTDGTAGCAEPSSYKQYMFSAGPTSLTALADAHLNLVSEANNHGEDCGAAGLQQSVATAAQAHYPVIGIGNNAAQAFAPYLTTVHGQRVAVLAATQVFDPGLQSAWTATATTSGVASAFSVRELVRAVETARQHADTVVVYLHWGADGQTCPDTQQSVLARTLVAAGADIVVGANAHVPQGAGYLGHALVDYGLGNLAFYDTAPPETTSGMLLVTVTGRHIDGFRWRPALLQGGVPVPLTGASATTAVESWNALRRCTELRPSPSRDVASMRTERSMPPAHVVAELSHNPDQS